MRACKTLLGLAAALTLTLPAAAGAVSGTGAISSPDRLPQDLPPAGARAAASDGWLFATQRTDGAARVARAHGARALKLPGTYRVPTGRARGFAADLRARGLLRWSQADRRMLRQSQFEGQEGTWSRSAVVAAGLVAPAGVPVGIVDDLVDITVPDVAGAQQVNAGAATVTGGHGTEVASVVAGTVNSMGVIGVLPGAPILSYGLTQSSCGEVADGLVTLARRGAKVVNLSLGSTEDCTLLQLAVDYALAAGTLVVAASGNEFDKGNPVVYPAAYPHVLSVGALDQALNPAYFSSANASMDIAAPGVAVPVARPVAFDDDGTPDGLGVDDGTSFAAPIVAGVASWVLAARPDLDPGQAADVLRHSARDLGPAGWDQNTGYGLIDVAGALAAPTPAPDLAEPNDGITLVNGTAFDKPDPYIYTGGARKTYSASVDAVEDPVDVYRVRVPAGRLLGVRLKPSAGNADLAVYDRSAKGLQSKAIARSRRGSGKTDVVRVRNTTAKARTVYVVVEAPSLRSRTFDAPYTLSVGPS